MLTQEQIEAVEREIGDSHYVARNIAKRLGLTKEYVDAYLKTRNVSSVRLAPEDYATA